MKVASPMPGRQDILPLLWLPLLLLLLSLGCAGATDGAESVGESAAAPALPPAVVNVGAVEEHAVAGNVRLVGTAGPWRRSTVASEVAGIVERLLADEGDEVNEGEVLAVLRRDILERLLQRQEADFEADQAAYDLTVSRRKRNQALLDDRVISQQTFDDSELFEEQAMHRVASDQAELLRLRELLEKTSIRAPFSGVVVRKETEVGEFVAQGGGVVEMVDPNRMEVRLDLPERFLSRMSFEGILVQCDAMGGIDMPATVSSIAPDGDPDTRTFPLRLEIPNPDRQLRGGMLCRSVLPLERARRALFVPKDAVVDDGRERVVFTIREGIAHRIPVVRGKAFGKLVEVEGDLEIGQEVVVRGNERLQDSQPVRILDPSVAPAESVVEEGAS
jgi:membrane fusion protein (multidrug efflux system)